MKIEVNLEEAAALLRLLEWTLPELREEIYKTESEPMRRRIKEQERILALFRERLDGELARAEVNELQ
ncbi:MAG TPA: hypothetical protein VMB50_10475 [Myxococcales bacterium]|nr:hypothetical protein [Myxococcales bacterium]